MNRVKVTGIVGLALLVLSNLVLFLKIEPFEKFYFPFMWFGFVLFVDFLTYLKNGKSWVKDNLPAFIGMFFVSSLFWKSFEFINLRVQVWNYLGTSFFGPWEELFALVSFSVVIPTLFVLLNFSKYEFKLAIPKKRLSLSWMWFFISLGILSFVLLIIFPEYFFPLEWAFLFLILDAINYRNLQPSILYTVKQKKFRLLRNISLAMIVLGIFWEFWNFFSSVRWVYTLPYAEFLKIFEMPILGYIGYIPFGLEVFAFYFFVRFLFRK